MPQENTPNPMDFNRGGAYIINQQKAEGASPLFIIVVLTILIIGVGGVLGVKMMADKSVEEQIVIPTPIRRLVQPTAIVVTTPPPPPQSASSSSLLSDDDNVKTIQQELNNTQIDDFSSEFTNLEKDMQAL